MKQTEAEIIALAKQCGATEVHHGVRSLVDHTWIALPRTWDFKIDQLQAFTTLTAAQPVQLYELAAIVDSTCGSNLAVQVVTTSIALRNGTGLYVRAQ